MSQVSLIILRIHADLTFKVPLKVILGLIAAIVLCHFFRQVSFVGKSQGCLGIWRN